MKAMKAKRVAAAAPAMKAMKAKKVAAAAPAMKAMKAKRVAAAPAMKAMKAKRVAAPAPAMKAMKAKRVAAAAPAMKAMEAKRVAGPEYAAVLAKRDEVADFKMAVVEGAPIPAGSGLVVGFFDMKDPQEFKTVYSPMAEPTLDPYGGKFAIKHALVPAMAAKMGMKESKGFGTTGQMAFVLQFADFEKAMGWFTGPEYAAVLTKRDEVASFRMAVVEGAPISPGSGLVIGFFDLKDPEEFKTVYSPMAEPSLDPYGGKFAIKHALVPAMAAKMGMKESKGFGKTG